MDTKFNSRYFNHVTRKGNTVTKMSHFNQEKIQSEWEWFLSLPEPLQALCPQVSNFKSDTERMSYELEYIPGTPLSQYYVRNGNDPLWAGLLMKIFGMLQKFSDEKRRFLPTECHTLLYEKTKERLDKIENPLILELMERKVLKINDIPFDGLDKYLDWLELESKKVSMETYGCYGHGDLCLSNMILNHETLDLKAVDPRGDKAMDIRYDFAKVRHSFSGYDHIMADRFAVATKPPYDDVSLQIFMNDSHAQNVKMFDLLIEKSMPFGIWEVKFFEVNQFLSMIPLHEDNPDRQLAFFLYAIVKLKEVYNERQKENRDRPGPHADPNKPWDPLRTPETEQSGPGQA